MDILENISSAEIVEDPPEGPAIEAIAIEAVVINVELLRWMELDQHVFSDISIQLHVAPYFTTVTNRADGILYGLDFGDVEVAEDLWSSVDKIFEAF